MEKLSILKYLKVVENAKGESQVYLRVTVDGLRGS
jgi:hypothetical protein